MPESRSTSFRRNELLESLLAELNNDLQPAEDQLASAYAGNGEMPRPLILVMGPLRSGTTLFMQWLANTGLVAYPTNLLSRFYRAPILGAKIQLLLTDPRYNFRDELGEFIQQADYQSQNGKTRGVLAPNEFWYFWRRFLAEPSRDVWSDEELSKSMDTRSMLAELSGMMDVFQKPFAAKGMLFNYNISYIDRILDKVIFVQMRREEKPHVRSVLAARKRQLGDERKWYSFDIPGQEALLSLEPEAQVREQIRSINSAIIQGLESVSEERKLIVDLEKFCASPADIYYELSQRLDWPRHYSGPASFN